MRILFVYQICSLGGVETVLRNRVVGLRRLGLAPRIAVLEDLGGSSIFAGIDGFEVVGDTTGLARVLEEGFDVVAAIDTPQAFPVLAEHGFRGLVVNEVHSNNYANLAYLEEIGSSPVDALLMPSRFLAELIERDFPAVRAAELPLRVVPNPIDTTLFRFVPPRGEISRPLVAWVGRLEAQKNWRHFLELAGEIARDRAEIEFLLVGGRFAPHSVKEELFAAVRDHALFGRLRWVPALAYQRMPAFFSAVAASGGCLVPTSSFEPFGMTVLEAMACRCPVVAAESGGLRELIESGHTGLHFPVNDTARARAAVLAVLDDARLRASLVANASARVESRYDTAPVAEAYLATLRELLATRRSRDSDAHGPVVAPGMPRS